MSSENGDNHPGELAVRVRGVGKEAIPVRLKAGASCAPTT